MNKEDYNDMIEMYRFVSFEEFKNKDLRCQEFKNKHVDFRLTTGYKYKDKDELIQQSSEAKDDILCAIIKSCLDFFDNRKLTSVEQALSIAFHALLWSQGLFHDQSNEYDNENDVDVAFHGTVETIFKILKTINPKRFQEIADGKY